MDTKDIFTRAYELSGEFNVARGNYHVDDDNRPTDPRRATGHCAVGFIYRAAADLGREQAEIEAALSAALAEISVAGADIPITTWNDRIASDADVRSLFRKLAGLPETSPVSAPVTAGENQLALV